MVKILQKEAKELRQKDEPVEPEEIGGKKIQAVLKKMQEALESQEDGVAIAAPQIGENLRIFVMSHRVFEMANESKEGNLPAGKAGMEDKIFINPKLIKISKQKEMMEEGCLS